MVIQTDSILLIKNVNIDIHFDNQKTFIYKCSLITKWNIS